MLHLMVMQLKVILNQEPTYHLETEFLVQDSITFFDLHHILQITMGWKNSHLFDFKVGDYMIGFVDDDAPEDLADSDVVAVDTLLTKEGMKFQYNYDFGDGWEHTIEIEKIVNEEDGKQYPICLDGEMNCPPEDWRRNRRVQEFVDGLE